MLRPFCMLLWVVAQSLKPVKLSSQQLPTFLLFRDRRRVAQQWWIRLHSSSNIVGATHAHYTWSPESYELYPSHDALQVPTLLGVFGSVCTPMPTRTQQLPTLLVCCCIRLQTTANTDATTPQHCWLLLHPFAHHCQQRRNNSQHCWLLLHPFANHC